ncbi:MAG TPA: hypothetical protein VHU15_14775 [Stellaceae bacterium]|nr:hypothetical protein [Stellaceae bacterium]
MRRSRKNGLGLVGVTAVAAAIIAAWALPAVAQDLKIRSPIIEPQELEFENNFKFGGGKNAVHELEYGFTDWLKLGVEAELRGDPGRGFRFDSTALEGFVQLTPQGKYWADLGLFAEFENTVRTGDPRGLTLGPLIQKEVQLFGFDTLHTANLLFTKQVGGGSVGPLSLLAAENSRIRLDAHFEPGIEYYGIVTLGAHGEEPTHRLGPAFAGRIGFGELGLNAPGGIKYDAAYLLGLTKETNPSTIRFRVELEFPL